MPVVPAGSHDGRAARRKSGHGVDWLDQGPERAAAAMVDERYAGKDAARMAELNRVCVQGGTCMHCGGTVADSALAEHPGCCATCGKKRENREAALERFGSPLAPQSEESPGSPRLELAPAAGPRAAPEPAPDPAQLRAEIDRRRDEMARILFGPPPPGRTFPVRMHVREDHQPPGTVLPRIPEGFTVTPVDPRRAAELVRRPPPATPAAAAPPPTQETTMPCSNCGKPGHNARSCPNEKKSTTPKAAHPGEITVPKAVARPPRRGRKVGSLLDDLEALKERGRARLEEIEEEIKQHEGAIDALNAEVAELHRFFEPVAGSEPVAAAG